MWAVNVSTCIDKASSVQTAFDICIVLHNFTSNREHTYTHTNWTKRGTHKNDNVNYFSYLITSSQGHSCTIKWMNEWMVIINAHKNFHTRICMFTQQLGRKKHSFTPTHRKKHELSTHRHVEQRQVGSRITGYSERSAPWEWMESPEQGIPLEGAIYLKAFSPYRFVSQSLGPGTSRNDPHIDRRERDGVYGGMSSERSSGRFFMDGMRSDRKKVMENTVFGANHPDLLKCCSFSCWNFVIC